MTHYNSDPQNVRVDLFKPSGKWYTTVSIRMDRYEAHTPSGGYESLHDTVARCLREQLDGYRRKVAVVLEPYHEHAHPVMLYDWWQEEEGNDP